MPAWRSIAQLPDGLPAGAVDGPGPDGEVAATSADGRHRWIARRRSRLVGAPTPGPHGPIMHMAGVVDHHMVASADAGQTWTAVARTGTTGLALDDRGRVWVAWLGGVDVADARAAIAGQPGAWRRLMTASASCIAVGGDGRVVAGTGSDTWISDGEAPFVPMPAAATERGAWGSYEMNARAMRALRRAPDGAVWGVVDGGVVRLAPGAPGWQSVSLGLTVIAGKGMRRSQVQVTAFTFGVDGTAYVETRGDGSFCRAP